MTEEETIRAAMRLLGMRTSPKKARASRRNGKLGGRKKGKKRKTKAQIVREIHRAKVKLIKSICSKPVG